MSADFKALGSYAGPEIADSGLVLSFDAGNTKSYTGSGTTWTNLVNSSTAALFNGPTFSSNSGGYFELDGVNDYILTNPTGTFSSTAISIFVWFYSIAKGVVVSELGQSTINTGWHDAQIAVNANGGFSFGTWQYSGYITTGAYSFNQWYYIGFTYDGSTLKGYVNGSLAGSVAHSRSGSGSYYYGLGATDGTNMGTGDYGRGYLSVFSVYNRGLSQDEVSSNYNALRGRFGL